MSTSSYLKIIKEEITNYTTHSAHFTSKQDKINKKERDCARLTRKTRKIYAYFNQSEILTLGFMREINESCKDKGIYLEITGSKKAPKSEQIGNFFREFTD